MPEIQIPQELLRKMAQQPTMSQVAVIGLDLHAHWLGMVLPAMAAKYDNPQDAARHAYDIVEAMFAEIKKRKEQQRQDESSLQQKA
jgi:hypothetical protein